MEAPEVGRAEAEAEEEGEEQFHDCAEIPTVLPVTEAAAVESDARPQEAETKELQGSAEAQTEPQEEAAAAQPGALSGDETITGAAEEVACDEDALRELEKELSEEERESRKAQSTCLKEEGNKLFKQGDYADAEAVYSKAIQICPAFYQKDRSILFSNRAAARMKQDKNDVALNDCSKAIELNPDYIRALLRRAELYEKTEKLDEALADYKTVLERDMSVTQAREACLRLPKQIDERNEKLKEEMISKLKDLGNLVLRPFGLSTENFQVNQDNTSGSYSINFVQNPNNNR